MNQETKRPIKKLVLDLRQLLEDDLTIVLKRYGLLTDRPWLALESIPDFGEDQLSTRERLEAAMQPDIERGISREKAAKLYIREAGFTHLNRLVGLKVLEVRGLILEVIQTRPEYGGRSHFHRDYRVANPKEGEAPDDALPGALEAMSRVVSEQIKFVFDVDSDSSILWPRYSAIKEAIRKINALPEAIWREDEIIGWFYQFYNAEEKEEIRKRGRPKLPIEVAVINQFFTPRWVVKFLVDNTLGRLWLEMHPDSERVRVKCNYLVPEPLTTEGDGDQDLDTIELDPQSPINNPSAEPRRDAKRPQDLKLIDPACGTMHFGHYAFEVFQEIYQDARESGFVDPEEALDDSEVPLAILHNNLFGVDIDSRAVQLAALSLYVKVRTAQRVAGMSDEEAANLPWRVNLVSADAHLTNGDLRDKFLKRYADDPNLQKVWQKLFFEMEDIAQVGSLLRVEERVRQLLQEYKPATVERPRKVVEQDSFPEMKPSTWQLELNDVEEAAKGWSPQRSIRQMLLDLRKFAKEGVGEHDINAQVFAGEAGKAVGLLDVLIQKYDVVVMNPPYGDCTNAGMQYLKEQYPITKKDLYAAFVEKSLALSYSNGLIGALTSRSFMLLPSYEKYRESILISKTSILAGIEFDVGLLDEATVRPFAQVLLNGQERKGKLAVFFGLRKERDWEKKFEVDLDDFLHSRPTQHIHLKKPNAFLSIPGSPFCYWVSDTLTRLFAENPPLDRDQARREEVAKIATVTNGLQTGNDSQFLRFHWEVPNRELGIRWKPYADAGSYRPYYKDFDTVVDWGENGNRIEKAPHTSIMTGSRFYFRKGLTYPNTCELGLSARFLPAGCIPSRAGPAIYAEKGYSPWLLLGILNSRLLDYLLNAFTVDRVHQVSMIARLPIVEKAKSSKAIIRSAEKIFHLFEEWDTGNETSTRFSSPWLVQAIRNQLGTDHLSIDTGTHQGSGNPTNSPGEHSSFENRSVRLSDHFETLEDVYEAKCREANELRDGIDKQISDLYGLSENEVQEIVSFEKSWLPLRIWPDFANGSSRSRNQEHLRRMISYALLQQIVSRSDGVLPVSKTGDVTASDAVINQIELEFGAPMLQEIEGELFAILGSSLTELLDGPFIKWHTKLYKRCPIIWHISSSRNTFGCLVYYHKMGRDTLTRVRTVYLWRMRDRIKADLEAALADEDYGQGASLESQLDDLEELDSKLDEILNSGWDVNFDLGVKINILPLQDAGVLRYKSLV